jgi:hypothetical protein
VRICFEHYTPLVPLKILWNSQPCFGCLELRYWIFHFAPFFFISIFPRFLRYLAQFEALGLSPFPFTGFFILKDPPSAFPFHVTAVRTQEEGSVENQHFHISIPTVFMLAGFDDTGCHGAYIFINIRSISDSIFTHFHSPFAFFSLSLHLSIS